MNQGKKSEFIEWTYIISISLALILHVFNESGVGDLKLFHIPTAIAFVISLVIIRKVSKVQICAFSFIIVTYISALLSPYPQALQKAFTFMIVVGSCVAIPKCLYDRIVKTMNWLIPIPLCILSIILSPSIINRFTGFYNDPNYLCTTLFVFLFIILQGFHIFKNRIIKACLICEIIVIMTFTLATLSRTGFLCIAFMIVSYIWDYIKKYKIHAVVILAIGIIYMYLNPPQAIMEAIDRIESREDNNDDSFSSASKLRYELSMRGIRYVLSNPIELPFGMGIGATGHWYFADSVRVRNNDHNTLTASFSEQGIIGFILYVIILYTTFRVNWNLPNGNRFQLIRLGAFLSIFIFSLSINQMTYLPYWWLIFLLNNTSVADENPSHSNLRETRYACNNNSYK